MAWSPPFFNRPADPGALTYYTAAFQAGVSRVDLIHQLQNATEGLRARVARRHQDELRAPPPLPALKARPGVAHRAHPPAARASDARRQTGLPRTGTHPA